MKVFSINNAKAVSGGEEHQLDLCRWLKENGHQAPLIVHAEGGLARRALTEGLPFFPLFSGGRGRLSFVPKFARLLVQERPDVLSINREHNILPVMLAWFLAYPFLRHKPRLVAVFHSPTGRFYPFLDRFDAVIGTSRYTAEGFLHANRGITGKTSVIYCGINLPDADPAAKRDRNRAGKVVAGRAFPTIGMIGDLWKNQDELIVIAGLLRERFPSISVRIHGGGGAERRAELDGKIAAAGLQQNVLLADRVPRERIPDLFHDLDLSVSTYRHEGFGIVHIEALASYTPVVAYNSGGLVEILSKGGGVLVDGGPEDFAAAVGNLLEDDGRRESLALEGRKVVEENFTIRQMCENHFRVYERVCRGER